MSNSIASLRFLSSNDWRDFVEEQSAVEHILRTDPSGHYPSMDFATRDQYRHVVERISRHSRLTESEVARAAVQRSQAAIDDDGEERSRHVGYHLVDRGVPALERASGMSRSLKLRLSRLGRRFPLAFYCGPIVVITGLLVAVLPYLFSTPDGESRQSGLAKWAASRRKVGLRGAYASGEPCRRRQIGCPRWRQPSETSGWDRRRGGVWICMDRRGVVNW
jgi:hypothetical protein